MRTTRAAWEAGINRELAWWRGYLETGGYDYPALQDEFRFRFDPDAPLQEHVARLLPHRVPASDVRILDCAAGPATTLGKTLRGERVALTAIDALADHYAAMLDELDLVAPVPSRWGEAEHLNAQFEAHQFHLVYMRFALDHCYNPIGALRQMVRVVKPGGTVMVEHYRDETQTEFQGLRHWSLHPETNDLVIANADHSSRVSRELPGVGMQMAMSATWMTMLLHSPAA